MKMNAKLIGHHDQSNSFNKYSRVHEQYYAGHSSLSHLNVIIESVSSVGSAKVLLVKINGNSRLS